MFCCDGGAPVVAACWQASAFYAAGGGQVASILGFATAYNMAGVASDGSPVTCRGLGFSPKFWTQNPSYLP